MPFSWCLPHKFSVRFKPIADLAPSTVQSTHNRADRYIEYSGSLLIGEAIDIDQLECLSLPGCELPERFIELSFDPLR